MAKKRQIQKKRITKPIKPVAYIIVLSVLVIVAYAKTTGFDFVNIDDGDLIYGNRLVTAPEMPFNRLFTFNFENPHYKPMVWVTWRLQYQLLGDSPWHFHLLNWLFHLANTILLFFIGQFLFKKLYSENESLVNFSAFALALFFAINPLRIESVAWATERKDVQFAFFFLLGWLSYIHFILKNKPVYLVAGAILYLLSGFSKSMGVTLIAVVILTDLWYNRKIGLKMVAEKIPFFLAFVFMGYAFGVMNINFSIDEIINKNIAVQEQVSVPGEEENLVVEELREDIAEPVAKPTESQRITSLKSINTLPMPVQLALSASTRFILWVGHILVPVKLAVVYPHNEIFRKLGIFVFIAPFIVIAIYVLAWIKRKNRIWLAGLLFFGLTMSPALALNSSGQAIFLSDRYTYIPAIGIFFIMVVLLNQLKQKNINLFYFLFAGISIFYFAGTLKNVPHWKNSETLFTQVLRVDPNSTFALNNRGHYYRRNNRVDEALADYTRCLQINPGYYKTAYNRGKIYFDRDQLDLALADFNNCLSVEPNFSNALANRGAVYGRLEKWDLALADLDAALNLQRNNTTALLNRGFIHFQIKQYEKTIEDYSRYLRRRPDNADVINTLGLCYMRLGDNETALKEFDRSIAVNPSNPTFYVNRSYAHAANGNKQSALNDVAKAQQLGARISPDYLNFLRQ